jgi:aspartyl protease family protein
VVLSPRDARRLGFDPARLDFSRTVQTAGGLVRAAPVRLDSIEIGELKLTSLPALVNPHDLDDSLLGVSFLDRLKGYEVADGSLILRW